MFDPELQFRIETWTERDSIEQCLAVLSDLVLARQCFDICRARFPKKRMTLRHGARVIMNSDQR
jgi:hypothetical protein